jgi:hypothetical protein
VTRRSNPVTRNPAITSSRCLPRKRRETLAESNDATHVIAGAKSAACRKSTGVPVGANLPSSVTLLQKNQSLMLINDKVSIVEGALAFVPVELTLG